MNGKDLLRALSYVDDDLINEAESKKVNKPIFKFAIPIAASFAIVFTVFALWPNNQNGLLIFPNNNIPPIVSDDSSYTNKEHTLYFNNADSQMSQSFHIEGHFWEELTQEQKAKLLPAIAKNHEVNGTVHYSHTDGVTSIFSVNTNFKAGDRDVKITISQGEVVKCYVIAGEPVISEMEGVKIDAGIFTTDKNSEGKRNYIYYADFTIDDISYYVEYSGKKSDKDFFASIVADIVLGGKADLTVLSNPTVPELRDDNLTEKEAYNESDFGAYLPKVPKGYTFNSATRFINQDSNYLFASWSHEYNDITFIISKLKEQDRERIVSVEDTKLYDMSLYPIPWADSMPRDTREIIENPIFKMVDLTLDIVKMREYIRGEQGDPSGDSTNMRFSVLYNDILVEISAEGVSSEYLFDELS